MIRFTCPSLWADRCSWKPTPEGLVVQLWHSECPQFVATVVIGRRDLDVLAGMCDCARKQDLSYVDGQMKPGETTGVAEGGGS